MSENETFAEWKQPEFITYKLRPEMAVAIDQYLNKAPMPFEQTVQIKQELQRQYMDQMQPPPPVVPPAP